MPNAGNLKPHHCQKMVLQIWELKKKRYLDLNRFKRHAVSMKWRRTNWSSCLVNLRAAEALTVVFCLDSVESSDDDKLNHH